MDGAGLDVRAVEGGVVIAVKAVPGAKRDGIAGVLGTRLKVRVSAPPEDGRANAAICAVIAGALGVKPRAVTVVSGHGSAEKSVQIAGISKKAITSLLRV